MNPALTETDRQLTAQDVGIWARVYSPLLWAHSMKSDRRDYELMLWARKNPGIWFAHGGNNVVQVRRTGGGGIPARHITRFA